MKVRYVIKFTKGADIKFIGHLDLMRTIQRIIKRSGLPVEYSKGFNPHMALSIAQPLSVGVYSDGEYLDLVLTESLGVGEVIEKLNVSAPPTIKFLHATPVEIVENVKRLPQAMALLDGARYIIKIKLNGTSKVEEEMMNTLNESKWEIVKKTKKGEKLTDIKPFVKEFKYWIKDNELIKELEYRYTDDDLSFKITKGMIFLIKSENKNKLYRKLKTINLEEEIIIIPDYYKAYNLTY